VRFLIILVRITPRVIGIKIVRLLVSTVSLVAKSKLLDRDGYYLNEEGVTILASNIRQSIEKLCGLEPQHTTTCEGYYFKWNQHTEDESKRSQIF
jgi:hypothetical protein